MDQGRAVLAGLSRSTAAERSQIRKGRKRIGRRGTLARMGGVATMGPIVPIQCWIGRTALGWSVRRLARVAGVSDSTVGKFERGCSRRATTVEAIQCALENAGVIFIDADDGGPGARLGKG
jgi:hypothetical protein